jgi:hypothetical protein
VGAPVPLNGSIAPLTNSTLSHGLHSIAGEYAGDPNFLGTTNSLADSQLINTPSIAGADTLERDSTNSAKVSIATLLSNDSDGDGDLLSFLSVNSISANGGTVVSNSGWIFYAPPLGSTNSDTFTYTIGDGFGSPVTATVTVNVRLDNGPSPNLTIIALGGSSYLIKGDGIPNRTYRLQYADTPEANWQSLGNATADEFGRFQLIDASGSPQRFYRSLYP